MRGGDLNGVEGAEKGGKSTCVQLVATIPPLRDPTRHTTARRKRSGRSGREDRLLLVKESEGEVESKSAANPFTLQTAPGGKALVDH